MNYKILFLLFFVYSCTTQNMVLDKAKNQPYENTFSNKGFTLVFTKNLKKEMKISKSLDSRSLFVFQNNLKKGTLVKITNLINNKSILATVGNNSKYPSFYNSVITKRIADTLELDLSEPYIEIKTIPNSTTFVANKVITFDEEKKVADKAPVEGITIKSIGIDQSSNNVSQNKRYFKYIIKIADFYFEDSANLMKQKISNQYNIKNIKILKISKNQYRVFLGPFKNLISLKNNFNSINKLKFENIEFIKL